MKFAIEQEAFSGPLGVLLELLEKNELEITDVNLAHIADQYLAHLAENDVLSEELADFLLIASRLIYLKTRELMPYLRSAEEDEQIENLEDQLRLYRLFAAAADKIDEAYSIAHQSFARPFVKVKQVQAQQPLFSMAPNVTTAVLRESFGRSKETRTHLRSARNINPNE